MSDDREKYIGKFREKMFVQERVGHHTIYAVYRGFAEDSMLIRSHEITYSSISAHSLLTGFQLVEESFVQTLLMVLTGEERKKLEKLLDTRGTVDPFSSQRRSLPIPFKTITTSLLKEFCTQEPKIPTYGKGD